MSSQKVKTCNLGCGKQIYWDVDNNYYVEADTGVRHRCPNYVKGEKPAAKTQTSTTNGKISSYTNNKKEKEPMENGVEIIQGGLESVEKFYTKLSDLITLCGGKVHGSQSHIYPNYDGSDKEISIFVYYEVPVGKRQEVKRLFEQMEI